MDFGKFRRAAAAAADAVGQLQSLDAMAEQDEYLKTEGLNVKRRKQRRGQDNDDHWSDGGDSFETSLSEEKQLKSSWHGSWKDDDGRASRSSSIHSTRSTKASSSAAPPPPKSAFVLNSVSTPVSNGDEDGQKKPPLDEQIMTHASTPPPRRIMSSRLSSMDDEVVFGDNSSLHHHFEQKTVENEQKVSSNIQSTLQTPERKPEAPTSTPSFYEPRQPKEWSLLDSVFLPTNRRREEEEGGDRTDGVTSPLETLMRENNIERKKQNVEAQQQNQEKSGSKTSFMLSVVAALMEEEEKSPKRSGDGKYSAAASMGFDAKMGDVADDYSSDDDGIGSDKEEEVENYYDELESGSYDSRGSKRRQYHRESGGEEGEDNSILSNEKSDVDRSRAEDEDEDDPIMGLIRQETDKRKKRFAKKKVVGKKGAGRTKEVTNEEEKKKTKNPHRFMDDFDNNRLSTITLDETESAVVTPIQSDAEIGTIAEHLNNTTPSQPSPRRLFGPGSLAQSENKIQWLRDVAAPSVQSFMSKFNRPAVVENEPLTTDEGMRKGGFFSRKQPATNNNPQSHTLTQDDYNVVVSTSLLAREEAEELERMRRSASESSSLFLLVWSIIRRNPRFGFIAFTLILAAIVYFYSRHRGNEDDVT